MIYQGLCGCTGFQPMYAPEAAAQSAADEVASGLGPQPELLGAALDNV
jgi:hypothetical protein